jgi:chromosome segregation ATPase
MDEIKIPRVLGIVGGLIVAGVTIAFILMWVGYGDLNQRVKDYREQLTSSRETVDRIEVELGEARKLNDELEREIEFSRERIVELEARAGKLEKLLGEAGEYIGQLETANIALREGSELIEGAITDASERVRQLIEDLEAEKHN